MAASEPSTSKDTDAHHSETLALLVRLTQKCEKERREASRILEKDALTRAEKYTGLHRSTLNKLLTENIIISEIVDIDRSIIQSTLTSFYLQTHSQLPSTRQLFQALNKKIPEYIDIRSLRKILVRLGYYWKKLPGDFLVILERPSITFERHDYLKNIINCRKEKKPIYFIHENCMNKNDGTGNGFLDLHENINCIRKHDLMVKFQVIYYVVAKNGVFFLKIFDDFNPDIYENWIMEHLLSLPPSVIVIRNTEYSTRQVVPAPTLDSLKREMVDWLQYHDVPCNLELSKSELYTLIEKYTNTDEKLYKIDLMMKLDGHTVLRIPQCISRLTPGYILSELIDKNFDETHTKCYKREERVNNIVESISLKTIFQYDNHIAEEEKKIFDTDIAVDKKIDDLLHSPSAWPVNPEDEDSDLPLNSDTD